MAPIRAGRVVPAISKGGRHAIGEIGSSLEEEDREVARLRKAACDDTPRSTAAHDHDIEMLTRHGHPFRSALAWPERSPIAVGTSTVCRSAGDQESLYRSSFQGSASLL